MTTRHPELAAEQRVLQNCHDAHEQRIAKLRTVVEKGADAGADRAAQRALRDDAVRRLGELQRIDTRRLVVGRLDRRDESRPPIYIGPVTIMAGERVQVVDFTRDVARPFYRATEDDPQGLARRRTFDVDYRELRDIVDEVFGTLPPRLRKDTDQPVTPRRTVLDRVAAELERAREPHMRDMVATIVADQYRLIEAPVPGVLVVQGGPGTGKTAVALHRAVYVIRNHEDLQRILVVGPNAAFMAYISEVLPGLGESRVDQVTIDRIAETGDAQVRGSDPPALRTLKGDARLAQVVARTVAQRIRETDESYTTSVHGVTVSLGADEANELLRRERDRTAPYMPRRDRFRAAMRAAVDKRLRERLARSQRLRTISQEDIDRRLRSDRDWENWLERMWPTASAAQVVHELLTVEARLRAAGDEVLTDLEIASLLRRGIRTLGVHPWTRDDVPLLDEAQGLVQGQPSRRYGYVIVDEAQDLTPMQLRMIARRSSAGDLTLVGDIAQATGPWRYRDWDEVTAHVRTDRGLTHEELRIGYRVPRAILELANVLLPRIAPSLTPTEPVREARERPRFEQVGPDEVADAAAMAVAELADDKRSVGVIVPADMVVDVRGALAAGGIPAGDISTDHLEKRVTLLSSGESKGLEFDRVVVVEPMRIVTGSPAGWSELYVALSRATQQLVVVHGLALPSPLPGGVEPTTDTGPDASLFEAPAETAERPEISEHDYQDFSLDLDLDLEPVVAHAPSDVGLNAPASVDVDEPANATIAPVPTAPEEAIRTTAYASAEQREPAPPPADDPHRVEQGDQRPSAPTVGRLGGDFSEALVMAKLAHDGRTRRGTAVSYMGHLLGTTALVLEDGGTEAEAVAALLHDAVEDGSPDVEKSIRARFGETVASIVLGCTDPVVNGSFRDGKIEHLRRLEDASASVRRVALAEKLDNAQALRRDLERYGQETWRRMKVDQDDHLWYLRNLVTLFRRAFPSVLAVEFERTVQRIEELCGSAPRPGNDLG